VITEVGLLHGTGSVHVSAVHVRTVGTVEHLTCAIVNCIVALSSTVFIDILLIMSLAISGSAVFVFLDSHSPFCSYLKQKNAWVVSPK
jgi:hypothetical protein